MRFLPSAFMVWLTVGMGSAHAQTYVDFVPYGSAPINSISVAFYRGDGTTIDTSTNHFTLGSTELADTSSFLVYGFSSRVSVMLSDLGSPWNSTAGSLRIIFGYRDLENYNNLTHQIVISGLLPADPTARLYSYEVAMPLNFSFNHVLDGLAGTLTITTSGPLSYGMNATAIGTFTIADISAFEQPAPAVPEPAVVTLLMALGAGGVVWWRKRRALRA